VSTDLYRMSLYRSVGVSTLCCRHSSYGGSSIICRFGCYACGKSTSLRSCREKLYIRVGCWKTTINSNRVRTLSWELNSRSFSICRSAAHEDHSYHPEGVGFVINDQITVKAHCPTGSTLYSPIPHVHTMTYNYNNNWVIIRY